LQRSHVATTYIIASSTVVDADRAPILLRFENRSNQAYRISNAHHSAQQIQQLPFDQNRE
jgi:hypothetical protein